MSIQHGFELISEQEIPEYKVFAKRYRHVKTGAELLSLINEDENKVFGITFRTTPEDSTGVAHIMEHAVLNGSRKYPVKEPFVELIKGSLNTFLNAMTYPDKTCYPVASTNLQDFYNLVDVYLDSVFYPRLTRYNLMQEGWHYELDSLDEPLHYKGVVFNEMKGAYSSPESVLDEKSQQALLPDTVYAVDSGGNPELIPDLTYEQFTRFHKLYYHPSNARIYFYGDDPESERLRLLDEYLNDFEKIEVDSNIGLQARFDQPRREVAAYDASEDQSQKSLITLNWLLAEVGDEQLTLGLNILEHILIGTPASPLRKALIESGLGEDLVGRGMETGIRQMFFSTGLRGIAFEDADKVEALILDLLEELVKSGIDPDTLAASINTVEFMLRENNTGQFPRGLALMLRSLNSWLYDADPLAPLMFEQPLQAIKDLLDQGEHYFEDLIQNFLLENTHRVTVVLQPDPDLGKRRDEAERARLDAARASMDEEALKGVIADTIELRRRQEAPDSPEALATIPTLRIEDLDQAIKTIPTEVKEVSGVKTLHHDLFTNGIVYLDLGFDMHGLPQEWIPYMRLFGRALLETGTDRLNFVQLLQRIGRSTGGIGPVHFTSSVQNEKNAVAWFFLRGKATVEQTEELLSILHEILDSARVDDRERIRQMALEERAGLEGRLAQAGHSIVNARLRAKYTEAGWAAEQIGGISYLFFLRDLIERIDQDWENVANVFRSIRHKLVRQENTLCNVTVDAANWDQIESGLARFLSSLTAGKTDFQAWQPMELPVAEGLSMPVQVNFVGKGANLYELGYEEDGSVLVITQHLGKTWLWDKVRVQGGAYGAMNSFDRLSGVLTYLSYRDPNLLETLSIYDLSGQFLKQVELSQQDLTKAIIGAIGDLDIYQLPDAKGYTAMVRYLVKIDDTERQKFRDQVLSTSEDDFRAFGAVLERIAGNETVVVLGSAGAIERVNAQHPGWLQITRVL
jgi:presequence protease